MTARLSGGHVQNQLNVLSRVGAVGHLTDRELLARSLRADADEACATFTVLVKRHGPMVLGVCVVFGIATLVCGATAALGFQKEKPDAPAAAALQTPKAALPLDPTTAIIVPLPSRDALHSLLRRTASEALALAKANPAPSSWALTTIATAQAKAGDRDGARATFADAVREADGGFGGVATPWTLWRIGHFQAESGLKDEARATLKRAVAALPGVVGEYNKDSMTIRTFTAVVQDQARIGAREDARATVDHLLAFTKAFLTSTRIGNAREVEAPQIAAALAAVGDFEAAFDWSDKVRSNGNVLGHIADAASKSLDPQAARRFVHEAAERLAKLESADQTYMGLSDLAESQARLGDLEAAKRSARAIGEGPSRVGYDMTDGQPYAMIRIAYAQHQAGDYAGARLTLREAFRAVNDHPLMRGRDGRYSQIASGQIGNGDLDGAIQSVGAMDGKRADSLALVARAQAAAGQAEVARATFERALRDAGLAVENPPPPHPELARRPGALKNMSGPVRMSLAEIQAMRGDIKGAVATVRLIDEPGFQRAATQRVVAARATAGDVAGALRLCLDEFRSPDDRRSALQGLGEGVDTRLSLKSLDARPE